MSTSILSIDQVLDAMLDALRGFLTPIVPPGPPPPNPLPAPGLSVVTVTERPVGLGNRRGTDLLGPFAVLSLKGVRLEAVVRFQYWGSDPSEADLLVTDLQGRVAAAAATLRASGFLLIESAGATLAEHGNPIDAWRSTTDYRILYEFRYQDADGAESVISRIPIEIDSNFPDETSVSDDMVRWDDAAAPALVVRRKRTSVFRVAALSILAFLPVAWDGDGVTIRVTIAGTTHEQTFATVRDFVNAFALETEVVALGANTYLAGRMEFPRANSNLNFPVLLSGDTDTFRVSYQEPVEKPKFNSEAVVYLRALA